MTTTLSQSTPTRTAAPAGTWAIDPDRAVVALAGKASFIAQEVSTRFRAVQGSFSVEPAGDVVGGAVEIAVDLTTLTTGNPRWNELLRGLDPFDTEHHPVAVYRSTAVRWSGTQAVIDGHLTLRGITRALSLTASYDVGRTGTRMLLRAVGAVNRSAYGLDLDLPRQGKPFPKVMRLEIDVDLVLT
jgi:polyisoprenoid-binding protein YceI